MVTEDLRGMQQVRENLLYSGYTALVSALVFAIIFPLQLYDQTQAYFHFTFWDFLLDCLVLFFAVLTPVFLLLFLSRRFFGFLPHLLLLAMLLYFSLETGILSYRLPEVDGNLDHYGNPVRAILDSLVALGILLSPLFLYRKLRKRIFLFGAIVLVFSGALLFDTRADRDDGFTELVIPSTVPRQQVVQNLRFAGGDNVLVLIVDSISTEVVESLLDDHPELKAQMPGFVNFTNNVGMHVQTSVALPGIFSGEYFSDPTELPLYSKKVYASSSFIKNFLDQGSTIYVNLMLPDFSYTNSVGHENEKREESKFLKTFSVRMEELFPWNIREYYVFKIAPYVFKKSVLSRYVRRWEDRATETHVNDAVVYKKIAEAPVDKSMSRTLHVHHFVGGHPPFVFDAHGKQIKNLKSGYREYYDRIHFEFKRVTGMLAELRARGIYDDAFIVILGDHASSLTERPRSKRVPHHAFPAIMVKNRQAVGPFVNSGIPTSLSNVADLMKRVAHEDLSNFEIAEILKSDVRLYRQGTENKIFDWIVDENYDVTSRQTEIAREPLELEPLKTGYTYKFRSFNNDGYPDFIAHKGRRTSGIGLDFPSGGELVLRLPAANRSYALEFNIVPFSGKTRVYNGAYRIVSGQSKKKCVFQSPQDIRLLDVASDDNGIVRIKILPVDANYSLCFNTVLVKETFP